MLWLFPQHSKAEVDAHVKRWAPDLAKDSGVIFFHKTFLLWHFVIGGGLLATGWAIYGPQIGVSWLLMGTCCPNGLRLSCDMVCELSHTHLGLQKL